MTDSKAVDGVVDELLLGDGFSIVDSTKGDGASDQPDSKKKPSPKPDKDKEKERKNVDAPTPSLNKPAEATSKDERAAAAAATSSTTKDDVKLNGHDTKSDALLITTEEDLDLTEKDKKSEADKEENESPQKKEAENNEKSSDKRKQGDVWVSNITRHVKATDLKKHFSRHGKVLTAKIVTNGKSFFGYILMENADVANKCVRNLHGSSLDGRKLTVSRQRPDQRRTIVERKPKVKAVKPERKVEKKSEEKKVEKSTESRKDDALAIARRNEDRLKREVDFNKREVARLKRYLSDEQRRMRIEQQKNRTLGRELQEAESKLREERRKIERERDLFEKNQRTDRVKLENDRSMIKKELEEVKKLREYFKRKLEEEQSRPVERRPRASSPYAYSSKRFREASGGDKREKYVEERTRTPPSPPKLSSRSSKRSPVGGFPVEKERRGPSHHYNMSDREDVGRHSSSMVMASKPSAPAAPRNIWPSFHQEVWRVAPGSNSSAPFSSGQSYQRQSEYTSGSSSSKGAGYSSQQREFSKRDHYSSSSVRKY